MNPDGNQFSNIPQGVTATHSRSDSFSMPSYHWHNGYEIYLFISGNIRYCVEQHYFNPEPGCLSIMRPTELHRSERLDASPYERIVIEIQSKYLDELCKNSTDLRACFQNRHLGDQCHIQLSQENYVTMMLLADKLIDHLNSDAYGSDALVKATLLEILVLTNSSFHDADRIRSGEAIPSPVIETMQFIDENLSDDLTLQTVGRSIHYDAGYLSRRFREVTGLTVSRYIMYRRILHARELLLQGVEPKTAAKESGFRDYSVFYRSFIRLVGLSPSAFLLENKDRNT